jgi:hypothetical protein
MVLTASLFLFRRESISVDLFDRDGVPRRTSDRVFLAVVFGGEAAIDRCTVLPLPGDSLLNPTVNRLEDYRETRYWVVDWRGGLRFGNISFPGPNRVVSPAENMVTVPVEYSTHTATSVLTFRWW